MIGDALGSSSAGDSGGGNAAAGAFGGAGGIAMMGLNMAMNQANKKKQKKLLAEQRANAALHHNANLTELNVEQQNVEHNANMADSQNLGNTNDRNVMDSSIPLGNKHEMDWQKGQRIGSIERRRTMENADWASGEAIYNYQRQIAKNQQLLALINQLGGSGLGGAASMMGGMNNG
jgi:hypothetical protein